MYSQLLLIPVLLQPDGTLRPMSHRILIMTAVLASALLINGCSNIGYYSQAVGGHLKLMTAREPISKVLADESTPAELRKKLQTLVDARQFAVQQLKLPDNDSYSTFVQTGRSAVTWNVVATTEFSVSPKIWCFPVAGCVSYRGYFDRADAEAYAKKLAAEKHDVTIGGASAYSTLGWFDDPVLDTMLRGDDTRYVSTLFHELAHQVLYVKDDSNFNEAFASFVEQVGMRRWLESRGEASRIAQYDTSLKRQADFVELLNSTRASLLAVFADDADDEVMRANKSAVFDDMRDNYEQLKTSWGGYAGYDNWFKRDLNNARLVAVSTYRQFVPAFAAMYLEAGEDMQRFYEVAKVSADLPAAERRERLNAYIAALNATGGAIN